MGVAFGTGQTGLCHQRSLKHDQIPQRNSDITEAKINKWDYDKLKSFSRKGSSPQNEKATYGIGENIQKPYIS